MKRTALLCSKVHYDYISYCIILHSLGTQCRNRRRSNGVDSSAARMEADRGPQKAQTRPIAAPLARPRWRPAGVAARREALRRVPRRTGKPNMGDEAGRPRSWPRRRGRTPPRIDASGLRTGEPEAMSAVVLARRRVPRGGNETFRGANISRRASSTARIEDHGARRQTPKSLRPLPLLARRRHSQCGGNRAARRHRPRAWPEPPPPSLCAAS